MFLKEIDMKPITVPLIYDEEFGHDIHTNGQKIPTSTNSSLTPVLQGPRMGLLVTTLGNAASIISELIKVVKGVLCMYNLMSQT